MENKLELVDVFATWCGPCRMMEPILKSFGDKNPNVIITKIDSDENPEICKKYGIRGVPTFILLQNDVEVWRKVGSISESMLTEEINKYV